MPTEPGVDHSTETLVLLWAIRELGVVDALVERAGTAAEISAETDLSPGDAERLLTVCSDLGFVHPVDGEYELTNRALGFLAKRDLRSIGALPHELDVIDGLIRLPDRLTDGSNGVGTERPTGEHTDSDERAHRAHRLRRAPPPQPPRCDGGDRSGDRPCAGDCGRSGGPLRGSGSPHR